MLKAVFGLTLVFFEFPPHKPRSETGIDFNFASHILFGSGERYIPWNTSWTALVRHSDSSAGKRAMFAAIQRVPQMSPQ